MSLEDIMGNMLTEIKGLRADLKGAKPATGGNAAGATTNKPAAGAANKAPDKPAAGAANKPAAGAANKPAANNKPAASGGPPSGTKAPGGKHTIDEVREKIRKVAADVDKQSAKDILKDDGGGADKVVELKPEFYDVVYEACEVLLGGEGTKAAEGTADAEDDFA